MTIAIIWVLALLIMCPSAITLTVTREEHHFMVDTYNNSYPLYSCWEAWPETEMRRIYTTVLFSHIYVAPLALIVVMYARIAFKLFKSAAPARGTRPEEPEGRKVSRRKAKVINMLIIMALNPNDFTSRMPALLASHHFQFIYNSGKLCSLCVQDTAEQHWTGHIFNSWGVSLRGTEAVRIKMFAHLDPR